MPSRDIKSTKLSSIKVLEAVSSQCLDNSNRVDGEEITVMLVAIRITVEVVDNMHLKGSISLRLIRVKIRIRIRTIMHLVTEEVDFKPFKAEVLDWDEDIF